MDKYESFIGKILDGRYRILERVGVGGMAFVLKAEDLVMNRVVAIKILNEQYNGDETAEKRFINESKAVAMLSSQNIVSVYDVAIYPDIKYIVMEYLDGITLRTYMDNKKVLPWKEACVYTLQILRALEHAHGKDVIHRDIKPQNIMLMKDGMVKVTDFGIAKTPDMSDASANDKAIGTVYYISPEQASGRETTFASDLYSVGVLFYEMVTGELPFTADSPVTIAMMQINDTPKDIHEIKPDVPKCVIQIIEKAMQKKPEDRFSDAHSMLKAVDYAIKHPDAVFCDEDDSTSSAVNINMINTGDIGEYVVKVGEEKPKKKQKTYKEAREERKKERKKHRAEHPSHSVFPVITGVFFAFMIVVAVCAVYLGIKWVPMLFETKEYDDFNVRNLVGTVYSESLRTELEENNYIIVDVKETYTKGIAYGTIVKQSPEAGKSRFADGKCRITLYVNQVPDELVVPDVKYLTATQGQKILSQYGLKSKTVYIKDNYANEKQIVSTDPAIGTSVTEGTVVILYVCQSETVTTALTTPNVVGMLIDKATTALEEAYYTVSYEYENSSKPDGTVLSQDVPPFTQNLTAWTMVTLTISRYTESKTVENYFGMTLERATASINAAGFKVGSVNYTSSYYTKGTIISQSVASGTTAIAGTVINLVVSGEGIAIASPVPDVLSKDYETAKRELEGAGYTVSVVKKPASGSADIVLEQSIEAGTNGLKTGTEIIITVSIPSDYVLVENYSNMEFPSLLSAIREGNLKLGTVSFTLDAVGINDYCVCGQSIEAGEYVVPDTKIDITLYGYESYAKSIPNVIGLKKAAAVKALENAWYTVNVVYKTERGSYTTDEVINQSTPISNKPGTEITITVCIEQTSAVVPTLIGHTLDEIMDLLDEAGLALGNIDYTTSTEPDGVCVIQSPDAGDEVAFNTTVDVTLSEHVNR